MSDTASQSKIPFNPALLVVMCLATLPLLLIGLAVPVLANDEANYAHKAAMSWGELFAFLRTEIHPPLYYIWFKLWVSIFGDGELALRLSSLPFSIAAVLLFSWWAWALFPEDEFIPAQGEPEKGQPAALASLLFITSPFWLVLARLAKYFPLLVFLSLACVVLLWLIVEHGRDRPLRRRDWGLAALCGVSALLLVYTHYLGFVTLGLMGGWLLFRIAFGRAKRAMILMLVLAVAGLGFLPHLPILLSKTGTLAASEGVTTAPTSLARIALQLGYTAWAFTVGHTVELARFLLVIPAMVAFWGCSVWGGIQPLLRKGERKSRVGFLVYMSIGHLLGGWLLMALFLKGHPDLTIAERLVPALPFVVLLLGFGWCALPRKVQIFAIVLWLPAMAFSLFNLATNRESNQWEQRIPWREIAEQITVNEARPRVVIVDSWHLGSRGWYYLRNRGEEFLELRSIADAAVGNDAPLLESITKPPLPPGAMVAFVRSIRDSSFDQQAERASEELSEAHGHPILVEEYVRDSEAMLRMKELFRRGSGIPTHPAKIRLEIYQVK